MKTKKLKCKNNHNLIFVKRKKGKSYFKHKNSCDVHYDMTKWHKDWQDKFEVEETEIDFKKEDDRQIKDRRADVCINEHKLILELQHVEYNTGAPMNEEVISYLDGIGFRLVEGPFAEYSGDGDYHFVRYK